MLSIKIITMNHKKIEHHFVKANTRLMNSLSTDEKDQAISEFQALYTQEMDRLKVKLERGLRVQKNIIEKEHNAQDQKRVIETSLKERMQIHFKKRENIQLQKLKNYQRVEGQWRDKLKTIAIQVREKQKQSALNSNRLSKEALIFLQEKQEQRKISPPKENHRYYSHDHASKIHSEEASHFLTEAPQVNAKESIIISPHFNFPTICQKSHVRALREFSKSVAMQRHKSQMGQSHLLKSNQLWREKEGINLQKVMEKLSHIEQTRKRAKSRLATESQRIRKVRLQKDQSHEERFFHLQQEYDKPQRISTSLSVPSPNHTSRQIISRAYQLKVGNNKTQLQDIQFRERSRHFEEQLRKQRKGGFRKMVREAVQSLKLQQLRRHPTGEGWCER